MSHTAVLTSVRHNTRFIERWVAYYAPIFGAENLYVMFDGQDQEVPPCCAGVNVMRLPFIAKSRLAGDKHRARRASALARLLLSSYKLVIGTDVDEFLAVDPALELNLSDYLRGLKVKGSVSALGLDVAECPEQEQPLDWSQPFLKQRRFAKISDRYTKALALSKPLQWGSGQHRVKCRGFHIDPHLYLFHFGSVSQDESQRRFDDPERKQSGWDRHQDRRASIFNDISSAVLSNEVIDGDLRLKTARQELSRPRSLLAWNKPKPLKHKSIIEIPKRFASLM